MEPFQKNTFLFGSLGTNLTEPVDRLPPGKHRLLLNCRSYGKDHVQGRQGLISESNQPQNAVVHSIHSLNDPIPSPPAFPGAFFQFTRFLGIGTNLWVAISATDPGFFAAPLNLGANPAGFSGKPLSFVNTASQFSARPFSLIGDGSVLAKANSASQLFQWGITPPNIPVLNCVVGPANPNGPDIGTTGVPYKYIFRARADSQINSGAVSNWGPVMRNSVSPSSAPGASTPPSNIIITVDPANVHPDPQVKFLDVARYGGSITTWKIIGSIPNVAGLTLVDEFNDLAIAGNLDAEFDDNQPFTSVGPSFSGTCTITSVGGVGNGCSIALDLPGGFLPWPWQTGNADTAFHPAGNAINVGGTQFTLYQSPIDTRNAVLTEDWPGGAGTFPGIPYSMNNPTIENVHLPCVWGPFGGGLTGSFIFACGDPYNPGALYWTKGNHPESHPGRNSLFITSASEPLMNGDLYNGTSYVFSTKRQYAIFPNFGGTSDFIAIEVPNSKGMYGRWAKAVTPWGIAIVSKNGIFLCAGGPPISLTDEDLMPLFPQESSGNEPSAYPVIDGLVDFPVIDMQPDMRQQDNMFLTYGDGFLYFTYLSLNSTYRTWTGKFDEATGRFLGWTFDSYTPQVSRNYYEITHDEGNQAFSRRHTLCGTVDGRLARMGGDNDLGTAIVGNLRTGSMDVGDPRPRKFWGDGEIDLDSECDLITIRWGFDNFTYFSATSNTSLNLHGRHRAIMDINTGKGQYAYNAGLDITWTVSSGQIILYLWTPAWLIRPELTALRVTAWDDCGYPGAKFIQGFKLRADTLNIARNVQVLDDLNVAHSFTPTVVQHNGEQTIAYSFNTPFISHLVRFWPQDAAFWRVEAVEWVFAIAPELVTTWTSQEMTHGIQGWGTHRDAYVALISSGLVTLTVNAIANPLSPFSYTFPSTGSSYSKIYKSLQAMKGLAWSYSLTSPSGFRLFSLDSEVRVKQFGSTGPFLSKNPFGDFSHVPEPARI
jgi:hypothetical protein